MGRGASSAAQQATEDFIGLNAEGAGPNEDSINEVDRLREENKRLKKTLLEKFAAEEDSP